MYAPAFHPAMRFVGPTRREIGIRTVFNILGPIDEPGRGKTPADRRRSPGNCAETGLGVVPVGKRACSARSCRGGARRTWAFGPVDGDGIRCQGRRRADLPYIAIGCRPWRGSIGNARRWRRRRKTSDNTGRPFRRTGPRRDVTLMNAGAGIYAAEAATSIAEGVERGQDRRSIPVGPWSGSINSSRCLGSSAPKKKRPGVPQVTHVQTGTILDEILARTTADWPSASSRMPVSDLEVGPARVRHRSVYEPHSRVRKFRS